MFLPITLNTLRLYRMPKRMEMGMGSQEGNQSQIRNVKG